MPTDVTLKLGSGVPIGGVAQDERGQALAGVRVLLSGSDYRGFTLGNNERRTREYSEVSLTGRSPPAAVTDANGRWRFNQFPAGLANVEVTFVRPDGGQKAYATPREYYFPQLSVRIKGYKLSKRNPSLDWLNGGIVGRGTDELTDLTLRGAKL